MADEQFHQANNKWDVKKNQEKTKKEETNNNNKTQKYERSLGNNQVEEWLVA